jgi:hypothetical protein
MHVLKMTLASLSAKVLNFVVLAERALENFRARTIPEEQNIIINT